MNLIEILDTLTSSQQDLDLDQLKKLHQEFFRQISSLDLKITETFKKMRLLNNLHDAFMKRALELAELTLKESEIGMRPSKLCWLLFGSGARGEQSLRTDQDNGILYRCGSIPKDEVLLYVEHFAELGTAYLNYIGYPFCPGNVMATNPRWSNEMDTWLEGMNGHLLNQSPNDLKFLLIAADLRGLYGDVELTEEAKKNLFKALGSSSNLIKRMHEHIQEPKVSLGILGNILTERFGEESGMLNIKTGFYVPLVHSLKFLAIQNGILASSSLQRLYTLTEQKLISNSDFIIMEQAIQICLHFRWLASLNQNEKQRDFIDIRALSFEKLEHLKFGLKEVKTFHSAVKKNGRLI